LNIAPSIFQVPCSFSWSSALLDAAVQSLGQAVIQTTAKRHCLPHCHTRNFGNDRPLSGHWLHELEIAATDCANEGHAAPQQQIGTV
jgi:hypothetical protein